jgi:flagellar hook assembly protein FlgD
MCRTLLIFDLKGHFIRTIVAGEKEAGHYTVVWDGRNSQGELAPSGVYIYRLTAGGIIFTNKMVLLK